MMQTWGIFSGKMRVDGELSGAVIWSDTCDKKCK